MMQSRLMIRCGALGAGVLMLAACSSEPAGQADTAAATNEAATANATAAPSTETTSPAAPATAAAAAPAPDNTDTIAGVQLASYTGDAAAGETVFIQCKTCHDPVTNKIGPHLGGVVGRKAGSIADYSYTPANKNSGITWSPEKLFQYLEKPQRVVPGTKMAFAGISDPQKRADVIAYLGTLK